MGSLNICITCVQLHVLKNMKVICVPIYGQLNISFKFMSLNKNFNTSLMKKSNLTPNYRNVVIEKTKNQKPK